MNIKIDSGANVQLTDKPIYNIFGDVVQQKTVSINLPDDPQAKPPTATVPGGAPTGNTGGRPRTPATARLRAAFDYNPGGHDARSNQRLATLYATLRQLQWVAETDQRHFIELFQGGQV